MSRTMHKLCHELCKRVKYTEAKGVKNNFTFLEADGIPWIGNNSDTFQAITEGHFYYWLKFSDLAVNQGQCNEFRQSIFQQLAVESEQWIIHFFSGFSRSVRGPCWSKIGGESEQKMSMATAWLEWSHGQPVTFWRIVVLARVGRNGSVRLERRFAEWFSHRIWRGPAALDLQSCPRNSSGMTLVQTPSDTPMKHTRFNILRMAAAIVLLISMPACTREARKERAIKTAAELYRKGDYAAAEIEIKNALKADPGSSRAIKQIGLIRSGQGAHFEAAGILTQAMRMMPNDNEVALALAKSLFSIGFVPDSRKVLLTVLDREPGNGPALMMLSETSLTPEWVEEFDARLTKAGKKTSETRIAEALSILRRGMLVEGTALVDQVLQDDPGQARAHTLKAAILASRKEEDASLAEMKLAAEAGGTRSSETTGYARMLVATGRKDEAVAFLEKITVDAPDFLPAWEVLGQIAFTAKDDAKATSYFTKVLEKDPVSTASVTALTDIWLRNGKADKAVAIMETLTTSLPSRPALDLLLAKSYLTAESVPKAAAALDRVLDSQPTNAEAGVLRAQIFLKEGNTSEGIRILEGVRSRDAKDVGARDLLIMAYQSTGRNDDAVTLLREKAELNSETPKSQLELGQMLSAMGKYDEAGSIFKGALETFSDNLPAICNLANLDMKQGKPEQAMTKIDAYLADHPGSSEALTFKAKMLLVAKNSDEAIKILKNAIELKPDNKVAYLVLLGTQQGEDALATLDQYLKAFPDDSDARLSRGVLLQQLDRTEDSRSAFQSLIDDGLELAAAHNNLAALESTSGKDLQRAVEHAREARNLEPSQPAIADTLGWIEWQLGNHKSALPLLTEAAAGIANSPEVLYHLGMAQYSMGQSAEATASLTKAASSDVDFPGKDQALEQLARLKDSGNASMEDLQKRVAADPKDVLSRMRLAELQAKAGKSQEAFDSYQQVIDANPTIPAAWVGQARLLAGPMKSPAKALVAATKARELAPNDPHALAALGSAKLLNGNHEEAYGLLKDASGQLTDDASILRDRAIAAYSLGRVEEAIGVMQRVSKMDAPEATEANTFLMFTAPEAAQDPAIAAEVETALAKDAGNVPALMLQAELAAAAGKSPDAIYLQVLKLLPQFDPARVRLAAAYLDDPAKLDEALKLASKARASMPDDADLTRVLAMVRFQKGEMKFAAQLLSELAIKRPLTSNEQLVQGLAYAGSGEPAKAKDALNGAIKAGLSEADATKADTALAELDNPEKKK